MARPTTASPRSPSPSLAPSGTVRASSASGIKKIDRRLRLGHEGSFSQAGPLRDLYASLCRPRARPGVQLAGRQYDSASAYIKSQAHAGRTLIRSRYDDTGYSGGSTDRPDLQRLLDDIRARKLDVIVVYKVDRLTRSLADFAKLVELFDTHGVSFFSVTQQFNTTTSMGRLTLQGGLPGSSSCRRWLSEAKRQNMSTTIIKAS